ncbi:MAG: hypothetical protein ABW067_19850 [Rhizobacter sp.]
MGGVRRGRLEMNARVNRITEALGGWAAQRPVEAAIVAAAAVLAFAVAAWPSGRAAPAPPRALVPSSHASVEALTRSLGTDTVWRAMELRFPGATRQAADAAWAARQRGADDRDMMAATRRVQHGLVTAALATAPDPLLEQHAGLARRTLAAANEAGPLVCHGVLDGSLDLALLLPAPVVQADATFKVLLASTPVRRGKPLSQGAVYRAMQPVLLALTPAQVALLRSGGDGRTSSAARCEAMTAFYGAVARLPSDQRRLALRAALQR